MSSIHTTGALTVKKKIQMGEIDEQWKKEEHIKKFQTNAFGKIDFQYEGLGGRKPAKVHYTSSDIYFWYLIRCSLIPVFHYVLFCSFVPNFLEFHSTNYYAHLYLINVYLLSDIRFDRKTVVYKRNAAYWSTINLSTVHILAMATPTLLYIM